MTDKTKDAFRALLEHVQQIRAVLDRAHNARHVPDRCAAEAGRIRLTSDGYSGFNSIDKVVGERARAALGAFIDDERKRGERERDETLAECAAQLDALRASLQSLVGPAIVALGERAREMRNG